MDKGLFHLLHTLSSKDSCGDENGDDDDDLTENDAVSIEDDSSEKKSDVSRGSNKSARTNTQKRVTKLFHSMCSFKLHAFVVFAVSCLLCPVCCAAVFSCSSFFTCL